MRKGFKIGNIKKMITFNINYRIYISYFFNFKKLKIKIKIFQTK